MKIFFVIALLLALTFAFVCVHVGALDSHGKSALVTAPEAVDFGVFPTGSTVAAHVRLQNTTNRTITIDKIITSCGCTTAHSVRAIAPHSSVPLEVQFNSRHKYGDINKDIYLFAHGFAQPFRLPVHAHPYIEIAVTPESADFGDVRIGETRTKSVILRRTDGGKLTVRPITNVPDVRTTVRTLGADEVALQITYRHDQNVVKPGLSNTYLTGDTQSDLSIATSDPKLPNLLVPYSFHLVGDYDVRPALVDAGSIASSRSFHQDISIRGPLVDKLRVISQPSGVVCRIVHMLPSEAVVKVDFKAKGGEGRVIVDQIVLGTQDKRQPRISIQY